MTLQDDPSHLGPDLGPASREILEADGGKSDLLAFVTCFPTSKEACTMIDKLWTPFYAMDDYIELHSVEEAEETLHWYKAIWEMR